MAKTKRLKILHLLSQRPDSTGSGIYVQAMIREASARGHDNFLVAAVDSDRRDEPDWIDRDRSMFVRFHTDRLPYRIPGMSDVMPYESTRFPDLSEEDLRKYEEAFSETVRGAAGEFEPDIIHSHHLWIVSSLARRLFPKTRLITTCHGSDLRQFRNCPHLRGRVLSGCREIDVVAALCETQKSEIADLYGIPPERILVAGAGYDKVLFYPHPKPDPDPVQLVYAGKLSNAKGVPWLLRALKSIDSPSWRIHLVGGGSGEEKERCLALAKELGERVVVHGALPQKKLAPIVGQSHVLVLPSFYEGLPLVLLEGLASGCRIVATDLPGTGEVLGHSDAEFIALVRTPRLRFTDRPYEEDEEAFERNLERALREQVLAASRSPRIDLSPMRNVLDSYTWTGVFERVEEAYCV